MRYSEVIISGLIFGLFIALSAGPTFFNIIRYSTHHSYKAGLAFVLGVSFSDIIYVLLANLASNLMAFLEKHQDIVSYAGGALFIGIGLVGIFRKYKPRRPKKAKDIKISRRVYFKLWMSGFLMNTLNPGAVILWIGAAIKVTDYRFFERIIFFAICLGIILSGDMAKVFLADKIRNWLTLRKTMYLNKISATFILLFGVILLLSPILHFRLN